MINGRVVQFRRGKHRIHEKHFLVEAESVDSKEKAAKLIGSSVKWTSPAGKVISGKVSTTHGNKGVLRVIFEKGLPGQAITTKVEIESSSKPNKETKKEEKK